jgi:GDPmannose 4,6-dehydratase
VQEVQPDEICNLAAQSHVAVSFEEPEYTANSDALGPLRILEAIRILGLEEELGFIRRRHQLLGWFGNSERESPFYPRHYSPKLLCLLDYGKLSRGLRLFACNGILFSSDRPFAGNVRHAQDHARIGSHQARSSGKVYLET